MPQQSLAFKGQYRDLIPMGFTFQKFYGNNHRCYTMKFDPKSIDYTKVYVWQKGREVEYDDYYGMTADIFRAVLNDEKFPWKTKGGFQAGPCFIPEWKSKEVVIDRDTNTVIPFELYKHDALFSIAKYYKDKGMDIPPVHEVDKEVDEAAEEITRRFRKCVLGEYDLAAAKFMVDNNLIDLQ